MDELDTSTPQARCAPSEKLGGGAKVSEAKEKNCVDIIMCSNFQAHFSQNFYYPRLDEQRKPGPHSVEKALKEGIVSIDGGLRHPDGLDLGRSTPVSLRAFACWCT